MNDKLDLRVSGATAMPGGEYGKVAISGSGKIKGSLKADSIDCSGAAKVLGDVVTGRISASGAVKIEGSLQADEVSASGATKIQGDMTGEEMKLSGSVKVERKLSARKIKMSGSLSVDSGVEAEEVYADGVVRIGGLLNAETIELRSGYGSTVGDIGCSQLKVRKCKERGILRVFSRSSGHALEVDSIEADCADLEYTKAEVIRARDVCLGEGCHVRRVEYTGTCQAEEGTVKELVKVGGTQEENS